MVAAFAATMVLSGFLIFQVQPILAKFILPWFGGSSSTWLVCSLFFQLALLAGYASAYALGRVRHSVQAGVIVVALCVSVFLLPIAPSDAWRLDGPVNPTIRILALLLTSVGLPFVVLAMTTPLLSGWIARAAPDLAAFRFFVASNIGAFLALLTYPFLVEHLLTSPTQAHVWSWGFLVYAGLLCLCAVLSSGSAQAGPELPGAAEELVAEPVLTWVALSAVGSTLMLATSNAIMQWSAVVPFLWVLPLSAYLLSFVIAFAYPGGYGRLGYGLSFALLAMLTPALAPLPETTIGLLVRIVHHTATLFLGCMICHGELVARRPPAAGLPKFYLAIALGGAIGGLAVVVFAPLAFKAFLEHPIALACVAAISITPLLARPGAAFRLDGAKLVAGAAAVACLVSLSWFVYREMWTAVEQVRNFYGVVQVVRSVDSGSGQGKLALVQGGAEQGAQLQNPDRRGVPTCGMDAKRGLGLALAHHAKRRADGPGVPLRIGIVGLGVGMAAGLGRPGDSISYYEINPAVSYLAAKHFTFLQDSKATVDVSIGDGRLLLEQRLHARDTQKFDVLVLDAFRGSSPPLHLMTSEAFAIYFANLADDGILAVNMEFDTFDIGPLSRGLAKAFGMSANWFASDSDDGYCAYSVNWALLTKDAGFFRSYPVKRAISEWPGDGRSEIVWTDANSSLLSIFKWGR
jgi:hypothetical protein